MKTNKKAILGMLVAMVMSLGIMNGINKEAKDNNLQQVTYGCAYMACGGSEGGPAMQAAWVLVGAYGYDVTSGLVVAAVTNGWNPAGWVCGGAAIITGL
jgi:hypothetical protein